MLTFKRFCRFFCDIPALNRQFTEHFTLGNYTEAQSTIEKVLAKTESEYGATHPAHLSAMSNKALIHKTLGDYEEAIDLYTQALDSYTELLGEKHKSTLVLTQNLGNTYKAKGAPDIAITFLEKVVEYRREKAIENDPDLANAMIALAGCYRDMQEFSDAKNLLLEAQNIVHAKYGTNHILTSNIYNSLGLLYKATTDYETAKDYYHKALEIRSEWMGREHPEVLALRHNLAELYLELGDRENAQKLFDENLKTMEQTGNA